jgi:hypothetical protein
LTSISFNDFGMAVISFGLSSGVFQFWGKGVWGVARSAKRFEQHPNFLPVLERTADWPPIDMHPLSSTLLINYPV